MVVLSISSDGATVGVGIRVTDGVAVVTFCSCIPDDITDPTVGNGTVF